MSADPHAGFDRREFLRLVGGGIVVLFATEPIDLLAQAESRTRGYPADFNAYLRIAEDGRVTVWSGKIEMGQGVVTSLAQMAADELDVPLHAIDLVMGDTASCPYDAGTWGSMSIRFFGPALRGAAAEARSVLVALASERLKAAPDALVVKDGAISLASDPKTRVTYGELARGQKIVRTPEGKPAVKPVAAFHVMGHPEKRRDAREKVTGKAQYAGDVRLPGMLYAKLLRAPAHGAKATAIDTAAAARVPGVVIVNQDSMVASLHADPEQAERALGLVKATWDSPAAPFDDRSVFAHHLKVATVPEERDRKGDLAEGEKAAAKVFDVEYRCGYGAHAAIETHTALAKWEGGALTLWASTQSPFGMQQQVAQELGIPKEKVRVITPFVGGGFGGKSAGAQALEAARLARIAGKPVQVCWSRAEEFFLDTFRPATVVKVRSGIDAAGKLTLWDYRVWAGGARSAEPLYEAPHQLVRTYGRTVAEGQKLHLFSVGPWRAPGANVNVFARECQVDAMAAHAKADPVAFRLANLTDERMKTVLKAGAERFGWKPGTLPGGRGVGVALGVDAGTYVALFAQVKVDRASGRVAVERLVCAQDMGVVINPDGAKQQMEGCLMMGLGYTLSEEVLFTGGKIATRSFGQYQIPRFSGMPAVETVLVKNDALSPQGGGEPAIVPVGAAVGNAIFDATGVRLLEMPFSPLRVKEALHAAGKA